MRSLVMTLLLLSGAALAQVSVAPFPYQPEGAPVTVVEQTMDMQHTAWVIKNNSGEAVTALRLAATRLASCHDDGYKIIEGPITQVSEELKVTVPPGSTVTVDPTLYDLNRLVELGRMNHVTKYYIKVYVAEAKFQSGQEWQIPRALMGSAGVTPKCDVAGR